MTSRFGSTRRVAPDATSTMKSWLPPSRDEVNATRSPVGENEGARSSALLGASARLVGAMLAIEYGLLGLLAGVLGTTGGLVLSWALSRYLFHVDWHLTPVLLAAGVGGTALVVSLVGVVASADVLVRKPLVTLRSE